MSAIDNVIDNYHLILLKKIAHIRHRKLLSFNIQSVAEDELVNVGYFGFVQAMEKFNPENTKSKANDNFVSYATICINSAISQFLRQQDPLDHRDRKMIKKMSQVTEKLEQKLGREPTEHEIADAMGITIEKLRQLQKKNIFVESIDELDADTMIEKLNRIIGDFNPVEPGKEELKRDLGKDTDDCLRTTLNKDEMLVILLKEFRSFKFREIISVLGTGYNITRVQRMNERAKWRLKNCLENKRWTVTDIIAIYNKD